MNVYNGQFCLQVIRIDQNGLIDFTFNLDNGISPIKSRFRQEVLQLSDDSYLFTSEFSHLGDGTLRKLIKINTDGSLNSSFESPITNGDSRILTIAEQKDGKILIGGDFISCNEIGVNRIGRLNNKLSTASKVIGKELVDIQIWPNPTNNIIKVHSNFRNLIFWTITQFDGMQLIKTEINNQQFEVDLSNLTDGLYFLNLHFKEKIISKYKSDRFEYNYSEWTRAFQLPDDAGSILAHAKYVQGELIIHVPRGESNENIEKANIYVNGPFLLKSSQNPLWDKVLRFLG